MVRDTSIQAYHEERDAGNVASQEKEVLRYISQCAYPPTRREIAHALGLDTSSVSARVNALINEGLIADGQRRKDKTTGKTVYTLIVLRHESDGQICFA